MKHSIIYSILIGASVVLGALPFSSYDVGKLHPIKTIAAREADGIVTLRADTGDMGKGESWALAMEDMSQTASGTVLQGTVAFVILEHDGLLEDVLKDDALSPSCVVCLGELPEDLEAAGEYLSAHKPQTSLVSLRAEKRLLPVLGQVEGGFRLSGGEN